jgi:hypothetical protein
VLVGALEGRPVAGTDLTLHPAAPGLAGRVWQAAFSRDGASYVGSLGSRLLLNRAAHGREGRTDDVPVPWAEAYLAAYQGPPAQVRIGLSRRVYPAADKRAAQAAIPAPALHAVERLVRLGRLPAGLSTEEYFKRMHISCGSPEEVAGQRGGDRMLPLATDPIVQFSPAAPPLRRPSPDWNCWPPRWRRRWAGSPQRLTASGAVARPRTRTRGLCHGPPVMARQISY